MEKLVLIPYDKYQRMQARTRGPTEDNHGDSSSTQSVRETTISKGSVSKKKQIVVTPPPPGKRDKHTKTDPFRDWISF